MKAEQRAELEKLARAATGGDWRAHITTKRSPEIYTNIPPPNTPNPLIAGTVLRKADARFIAAANPATVLNLLATIARLEAEAVKDGEALGWYADPISYALTQVPEPRSAVHYDGGKRARARLSSRAKDQSQ